MIPSYEGAFKILSNYFTIRNSILGQNVMPGPFSLAGSELWSRFLLYLIMSTAFFVHGVSAKSFPLTWKNVMYNSTYMYLFWFCTSIMQNLFTWFMLLLGCLPFQRVTYSLYCQQVSGMTPAFSWWPCVPAGWVCCSLYSGLTRSALWADSILYIDYCVWVCMFA